MMIQYIYIYIFIYIQGWVDIGLHLPNFAHISAPNVDPFVSEHHGRSAPLGQRPLAGAFGRGLLQEWGVQLLLDQRMVHGARWAYKVLSARVRAGCGHGAAGLDGLDGLGLGVISGMW